jgi:hypothetical protein
MNIDRICQCVDEEIVFKYAKLTLVFCQKIRSQIDNVGGSYRLKIYKTEG